MKATASFMPTGSSVTFGCARAKTRALSRIVCGCKATTLVRPASEQPGSQKAMCPSPPIPNTCRSIPPASRICSSYSTHSAAGSVANGIVQHHDWLPTFLAMAGEPDVAEKLKQGHTANGKSFRNHIDGYNLLPYLTGEEKESPRNLFVYFSDDGDVLGLRFDNWKVVFMEQRATGTLRIWAEPFVALRLPKLFNLRTDPYERADITSNTYYEWLIRHAYLVFAAQVIVTRFVDTFQEFPPRQKAASFTIDQALEKMRTPMAA